jgi:hypothetical protein
MSQEPRQSPVWEDVMRVWSDPRGLVDDVLREGRGWSDWWRVLVLYGLGAAFSLVLERKLATAVLREPVFGKSESFEFSGSGFEILLIFGLAIWLFGTLVIQWLVLPRAAGWFGGHRSRFAASATYYLFFAMAFLPFFAYVALDLMAVAVHRLNFQAGSALAVAGYMAISVGMLHWAAVLAQRALDLPSYARGLGAMVISLLIAMMLSLLLVAAIIAPIAILFPDWVAPPQ